MLAEEVSGRDQVQTVALLGNWVPQIIDLGLSLSQSLGEKQILLGVTDLKIRNNTHTSD